MKARITKFKDGFTPNGGTPYRLELIPENEEEKKMTEELNHNYAVWVSPCFNERNGVVSWWGKT